MDIARLQYFKVAAECENFTQAAEELHLSQPALSKSIYTLEKDLGVRLFDRYKGKIYLNDNGRILLRHAKKAFAELAEAEAEINKNRSICKISIANILTPHARDLIKNYLLEHPDVSIHKIRFPMEQTRKKLEAREVDFAMSFFPIMDAAINWKTLICDRYYLAVSENHPLAQRESVYLSELRDERFLVNNTYSEVGAIINRFCMQAGFIPNIAFEDDMLNEIKELVEKCCGIGLVPKEVKLSKVKNIHFIEIKDPDCIRTIGIASLKDRALSPQAQDFYDYFVENLSDQCDQ